MSLLLFLLEADWSVLLRQMLTPAEVLLLLQVDRSPNLKRLAWAQGILTDAARLRRVMEPLKTMQLQFPGFHRPVDIRCTSGWTPPDPLDPLQTLGPVEDLLYWLDDFGLGAFSPVEAILVMNAWPAGATRQAAAALSDLLAESNSDFFFAAKLAPRRAGTRARHTVVNVVVFFTYRGLNGVLQMEDTT